MSQYKPKSIINIKEDFPHLSKAPIVEAVIDIRAVLGKKWDDAILRKELQKRLSDYPKIETLKESKYQLSAQKPEAFIIEDLGCVGLKLHCKDNPYIVQFNKGTFVFSRLTPYEDWGRFTREALRLMKIYSELLEPIEVKRIGLRFINRISMKQEKAELKKYYKSPPESLKGLDWPLGGFFHRDVIRVPGTSYAVNLIKTVQNSSNIQTREVGLILDIDVFINTNFDYSTERLVMLLDEMRWVKNKIFFGSITDKSLEEFK